MQIPGPQCDLVRYMTRWHVFPLTRLGITFGFIGFGVCALTVRGGGRAMSRTVECIWFGGSTTERTNDHTSPEMRKRRRIEEGRECVDERWWLQL
jgi:hypothetical protein